MKKIFYKYYKIVLFVLLLLFFPYFFDKIIMNKFITNWDLHDWAGFLGAYVGGFITLSGIWWQVTREEKQKEKDEKIGLLKTILYYLKQNIKDRELKEYYFYSLSSYKIIEKIILQNYDKYKLIEINKDFLYSNLKEIFKLENAENIVEIADEITKYNVLYNELISEIISKTREIILKELKGLDKNFEANIKILESISNLLNFLTLIFSSSFGLKRSLDIVKQKAKEIVESYKEKNKTIQYENFNENQLENEWENLVEELTRDYETANYKDIYWKLSLLIDHVISDIKFEISSKILQINEISKARKIEEKEQKRLEKLIQFLDFFKNKLEYHNLIRDKLSIYSRIEELREKIENQIEKLK
ncbi:hypothetical protein KST83_09135 [Fusobacterium nucleatum]|uniref:Uncharacterized protein n=1 Tax=Fusobacterium nucleatum subsp. polymorphum TaxID=76857 RepID=A0A2C6AXW4_FUSNP|nr:hypothetical protein [Fusobacterium polymorphum]PHH96872.1 hypothetical protein CA840_05810 [Fusobacterium polymorphum]